MQLNDVKTQKKDLINQYFNIHSDVLPEPRAKAKWKNDNKHGFFMGILEHGEQVHIHQMHQLLSLTKKTFEKEQELSQSQASIDENIQAFISKMYDYYILPFYQSYSHTDSPQTGSIQSSEESIAVESKLDADSHELNVDGPRCSYRPSSFKSPKLLNQRALKIAAFKRDAVCLFCWRTQTRRAARIIKQRPSLVDRSNQLQEAGLVHEHQVQNGLLLCSYCHACFGMLKYYVDVVDNQLVVKIVNGSNDIQNREWKQASLALHTLRSIHHENWIAIDNQQPKSEKYLDWEISMSSMHSVRCNEHRRWITRDDRQPMEPNGEMALYFVSNNPEELPNRTALQFHKTACLIWRMAGGADDDDESSDKDNDDDRRVVPIAYNRKNVLQWIHSNATVVVDTTTRST